MSADYSRIVHCDALPATLAVAVCGFPQETHAGIVYLGPGPNRVPHFLHFATHRDLILGTFAKRRHAYACVALPLDDPGEAVALAGYCRLIFDANATRRTIPYNFRYEEGTHFDPDTGEAIIADRAAGMSCATFVLHVFRSAGLRLIDTTGWRIGRPGDQERIQSIINAFQSDPDPDVQQQAQHLDAHRCTARIRPEEVAGACLAFSHPVNYSTCEFTSRLIVAMLDRIRELASFAAP